MPLGKLALRPGILTQASQTQNEGGWSFSNLIQFKDGFLQKINGWLRLSDEQFGGVVRGMHAYQDIDGNDYIVAGSTAGAEIYFDDNIYQLTQFDAINEHQTEAPWVTSTNGSSIYTLTVEDHGLSANDVISLVIPISIGGKVIWPGTYTVSSVVNVNSFRIQTSVTASANDTGGEGPRFNTLGGFTSARVLVTLPGHDLAYGDVFTVQRPVVFSLGIGTLPAGDYFVDYGDGADVFGFLAANAFVSPAEGTGYETDGVFDTGGILITPTAWNGNDVNFFADNYGTQIAMFCFDGGPLLQWTPPPSTNLSAVAVPNAPTINSGMLVAMPQAQVICYGADVNGLQDPLMLRWSDAGVPTDWTATSENQAGSFRLSRGSEIVGAIQAPQVTLVWTDIELWGMLYVGPPFVYSFSLIGAGCGLIAPRARVVLGNVTYWMSQRQFFMMSGSGFQPLPCPVWDVLFNDMDPAKVDFIFAVGNSPTNEVFFYYYKSDGDIGYVKYNAAIQQWDYGTLHRTAGIDQSVYGMPLLIDSDLRIQQHETGYDDDDAPMSGAYVESGFIELNEGSEILLIDQIIPDFVWFGENGFVSLTLWATNYPGDTPTMYGPYNVTSTTRFINMRARARQIAFKLEFGAVSGTSARLAALKYRSKFAGRRV